MFLAIKINFIEIFIKNILDFEYMFYMNNYFKIVEKNIRKFLFREEFRSEVYLFEFEDRCNFKIIEGRIDYLNIFNY